MSFVGRSSISPPGLCAHVKTDTWNRSGSSLSLRTVIMALRLAVDSCTWVGETVNVAAAAGGASGPASGPLASTSRKSHREARWRKRRSEVDRRNNAVTERSERGVLVLRDAA